ncbi:hypothetical protein FLX56_16955 [Synechococcus moorigangaii CMS01]|nr:hypothetical protein [Synechococcus moorigangaii CMS01]
MPCFSVASQVGDLPTDLRHLLAHLSGSLLPESIPLQLGFQRKGLGFRSAIALKLAAPTQASPQRIAQGYLAQLPHLAPPQNNSKPSEISQYTYEAIATAQGWLEFTLVPTDIGRWLDQVLQRENFGPLELDADLRFSCHYLQGRFHDLSTLATDYSKQSPQWHFEHTLLPSWEQTVLEAIAHCIFSSAKPHRFAALEQSLWELQRHCPLFGLLRTEPSLGVHYWQWFCYLAQFLDHYLPKV